MKKVISLVAALVLVLCSVSAFAAGSPDNNALRDYLVERMTGAGNNNNNTTGGTGTAKAEVTLVEITPTGVLKELIDKILAGGKVAKVSLKDLVPADFLAKIKDDANINELIAMSFKNNEGEAKQITFTFETPYKEGTEVTILIGIPGKTIADTEWIELVGVANAAGSVVVTVSEALMTKLANNPFLVMALDK